MSRFNLIDEKWIPVRFPDGSRDELGIRDTLLRAGEIASIEDPSPLVVAALYRFLLAVLYRALEGPADFDNARSLFSDGFPKDKVVQYLQESRDRFWLFHEKYPFGQNINVPAGRTEPWTKLTAEHNATSNKVLFDHTDTKLPGSRKPEECVRWLLATMNFSIAGGRGYYPSPSPNAMFCIALGQNLFKTLCYNLVPYPNRFAMEGDSALWEREPAALPLTTPKRLSSGYADLYTWPARFVLFEAKTDCEVSKMGFVAGYGFDNSIKSLDPMQPHREDRDNGLLPIQFKLNRGTWRDFDSLLPGENTLAPATVQNAFRLAGKRAKELPKSVLVLGLKYAPPNANVDFWRMESFALPTALAGDRFIRSDIKRILEDAEETHNALWAACRAYARNILSQGDRKPEKKDIQGFLDQMPVSAWYWSTLESRFHEILQDYTIDRNPDDIRWEWLKHVRDTLRDAWGKLSESVPMGDAWTIRALVKAETTVRKQLATLSEVIAEIEPEREAV
ncbi:MAG: type I-E CRISPR-associated protein Cse1/CasA [Pseudomonadota bacterium]